MSTTAIRRPLFPGWNLRIKMEIPRNLRRVAFCETQTHTHAFCSRHAVCLSF